LLTLFTKFNNKKGFLNIIIEILLLRNIETDYLID